MYSQFQRFVYKIIPYYLFTYGFFCRLGHTINVDTKMFEDGLIKVTLDKRNAQLPLLFDHTYVYRRENSVIVENSEGLKVTCNTVFNVCTFTISGWYFGKTGKSAVCL